MDIKIILKIHTQQKQASISFKNIENKHGVYKGKDCVKRFCGSLRKQAMKIINFKKKKNGLIDKRAVGII